MSKMAGQTTVFSTRSLFRCRLSLNKFFNPSHLAGLPFEWSERTQCNPHYNYSTLNTKTHYKRRGALGKCKLIYESTVDANEAL